MTNAELTTSQQTEIVSGIADKTAAIELFLQSLDVKERSRDTYRKSLKHYFLWLQESGRSGTDRADILAYKESLLDQYTAATTSTYITAVRLFYLYLEAEKILPNIAGGIKGAKAPQGFRKDCLTISQAKKILATIPKESLEGLRNYAIVNLLIRTGLRTVEIIRANVEDIRQTAGEVLLYVQGKGRDEKDAYVILTESTYQPILDYLNARGKTSPQDPLFTSESNRNQNGRLTTRSISKIAKDSLVAAGINSDRITAHSLRHSAITFSLMGGATVQEAQALARHSSINTTMIYAHNLDRISHAPERKIDELLG